MGSRTKSIKKNVEEDTAKPMLEKDGERELARANAEDNLLAFSEVIGAPAYIQFDAHVQQAKDLMRSNGGTKERMSELLIMHASTCRNNSQTAVSILPPISNAKALAVWINARISSDILVALDLNLDIGCVRTIQNLAYLNGVEVSEFLKDKSQDVKLLESKKSEEKPN